MTRRRTTRTEEPTPDRTLQEIQAQIATAADRLETLTGELALARLSAQLERQHFPANADELERMGTDQVCPSVAFEAHGDLGAAVEALGEAVSGLRQAAARTPETVRAAWRERILERVEDALTRQVLREHWR